MRQESEDISELSRYIDLSSLSSELMSYKQLSVHYAELPSEYSKGLASTKYGF
jgi:hypothetical protein